MFHLILPELYLILRITTCMADCACHSTPPPTRRGFLKKLLAAGASLVLGLVPFGAGLAVFLDPLRRKSAEGGLVRVTTLDALPADGVPRKFPVLADRIDAWNTQVNVPVGAVYLRRTPDNQVQALNVVCPHAGCPVDFLPEQGAYLCPCHKSPFGIDGKIASPNSPSPRPMDSLAVEVRNTTEIWVKFENFIPGRPDKLPA